MECLGILSSQVSGRAVAALFVGRRPPHISVTLSLRKLPWRLARRWQAASRESFKLQKCTHTCACAHALTNTHIYILKFLLIHISKINTSLCVHDQLFKNISNVTAYLGKWLSHCSFSNLPKETPPDKEQLMK